MDWEREPLLGMLGHVVREMACLAPVHDLRVLTDSPVLERAAGAACPGSVERLAPPSGEWTRDGLADLATERFGAEEPLVLLDQRNPLLTASAVWEAVDLYLEDPAAPVVSTTVPEDHPVQLRTLYNVVASGMLHLAAPAPASLPLAGAWTVSAPFPFDWDAAAGPDAPGVLFRAEGDRLVSAPQAAPVPGAVLWIRDGSDTARVAVAEIPPSGACGFEAGGSGSLSRSGDDIFVHGIEGANLALRLVPFTCDGMLPEESVLVPLNGAPARVRHFSESVTGFVYTVQQGVMGGRYGQESPFSPDRENWCAKTQRGADGRRLSGRQRFPAVFRVDPSLFVGSAAQLRELPQRLASGGVRGYDLGRSCLIRSEIDILRHAARVRQAAEQAKGGAA
jgi:hypothetical protein